MDEVKNCVCGHAADTHESGGYCAAPAEDGFCGCDRFIEAAETPAPEDPTTDQ